MLALCGVYVMYSDGTVIVNQLIIYMSVCVKSVLFQSAIYLNRYV